MFLNVTDESRARRTAWWVLGALFVFRLLYLLPFTSAFDLAGDECYYWDWGRKLDWGYFSKPPMIGWLMGAVGRVGNNSEMALRVAPLLMGTVSLWLLFKLGEVFYNARTGLLAMLVGALTPANVALNLFFTIDAPLVLCWTGSLVVAWRCVDKPESLPRWALLAAVLGLGYLSKQMMLVVPLMLIIFAAMTPSHRGLLRNFRLWGCIVISLFFLLPPLLWNWQHEWVTFKHTGHHFEASEKITLLDRALEFCMFPLIQAGVFTPLTWVLLIAVMFGAVFQWRLLDAKERFLVLYCAPGMAVFFILAMRQEIHPNWPAAFYISATVLVAAWLSGSALKMLRWPCLRALQRPALVLAAVVSLFTYAVPFAIGAAGLAGTGGDLVMRLRAWKEVGAEAELLLRQTPRPDRTFIVVMGHREHASVLAFYMPSQPRVFRFDLDGHVECQYEIWPNPSAAGLEGWDALIFYPSEDPMPVETLKRAFSSVEPRGEINIPVGKGRRFYRVTLASDLDQWPKPKLRKAAPPVPEEESKS